jgi:hypothetical protein
MSDRFVDRGEYEKGLIQDAFDVENRCAKGLTERRIIEVRRYIERATREAASQGRTLVFRGSGELAG